MKKGLLVLVALAGIFEMKAQELPQSIWDQVESYFEDQEEEIDLSVLYDRLEIQYAHPQDINLASYDDLQELRIFSDIQINDLLQHRAQYGDLLLLEELQSIPSFRIFDIARIRPFFKVKDEQRIPLSLDKMLLGARHEVYIKWAQVLEDKKGYKSIEGADPKYLGDKSQLQIRHRANYEGKLRYGFIMEKDPGEQLISDTLNSGLDYLTAHIYLKDYSTLLKDVAIGDYSISMGQGLIAHNGFGAGKSAWVTDIKRGGRAIRPYTSVNENGYFRGVAATLRPMENVELTLLGSRVNRDGNLVIDDEDPDSPVLFFSSLQTSGIHRSISEKEDKGIVGLTSFGTTIKYKNHNYSIAVNHLNSTLSDPLVRSGSSTNLFRFNGENLHNTSIDYSWRYRNLHLFGESAHSSTGGLAHIAGALVGLDKRLSLALLYRDYAVDYNAIAPNSFGESSLINNERGLYMGIELAISSRWRLRSYADVWKHPWLRSRISNPSTGKEYLVRIDYYIRKRLSVYAQYFYEEKLQNVKADDPDLVSKLSVGSIQRRQKFRLHFSNKVSKYLELRTRLEITTFDNLNGLSKGTMLYQDIIFKPWDFPLSGTARFALFDTDDNNSRLFAFENSILYEFGIPTYSGRGFRYYLNLRYQLTPRVTLEGRWARTYKNRGTNGSSFEEIDGDTRTDVKLQLRMRI